jgi:hypothetical protein
MNKCLRCRLECSPGKLTLRSNLASPPIRRASASGTVQAGLTDRRLGSLLASLRVPTSLKRNSTATRAGVALEQALSQSLFVFVVHGRVLSSVGESGVTVDGMLFQSI